MLWFAIHILLFILIVLLLRPVVEGLKNKRGKKTTKKSGSADPEPTSSNLSISDSKNTASGTQQNTVAGIQQNTASGTQQYKASGIIKKKTSGKKKKVSFAPVPTSYADLVKQPYTGNNFKLIQSDVREYQKALDGSPGMLYFHNTGTKCPNINQDRHIVIDSRSNASIFDSANADLIKSAQFSIPSYTAIDCKLVTIEPVDIYGRTLPKQTRYV